MSTGKQEESGLGLEDQRHKVTAYAALYDLDLVDVVEEVASAGDPDRPGLASVLARLRRREAQALLVVKLDRLTRRLSHMTRLLESDLSPKGAALLSVGEQLDTRTATGRLILNVLGSVAEWEREAAAERTAAAMAVLRRQGRHTGGEPPFGFSVADDGLLAPEAREQAVLSVCRERRATGASLRGVVRELAQAGAVGRTGRPLSLTQVARILGRAA